MLFHKIIHVAPFTIIQPVALIEFKPYAPIVAQTFRKFDAFRLILVIVDLLEYRSFTSVDLMELTYHHEELRLAIGDMSVRELGKALGSIEGEDFGGYRLRNDGRDADGVIWRAYPA